MFHTFMIEYFCKITGIKRNNSQTILRVAITGTYLRVLFLAKSNFFADTAKVGRRDLQI